MASTRQTRGRQWNLLATGRTFRLRLDSSGGHARVSVTRVCEEDRRGLRVLAKVIEWRSLPGTDYPAPAYYVVLMIARRGSHRFGSAAFVNTEDCHSNDSAKVDRVVVYPDGDLVEFFVSPPNSVSLGELPEDRVGCLGRFLPINLVKPRKEADVESLRSLPKEAIDVIAGAIVSHRMRHGWWPSNPTELYAGALGPFVIETTLFGQPITATLLEEQVTFTSRDMSSATSVFHGSVLDQPFEVELSI